MNDSERNLSYTKVSNKFHTNRSIKLQRTTLKVIEYSFLTVYAAFVILPLLFSILSSIRPTEEIFKYVTPFSLKSFVPQKLTIQSYYNLFVKYKFGLPILNTAIVGIMTVVSGVFISSLAGFAFAKFNFKGKAFWYAIVLITMMIPFEAISIPLYSLVNDLGWLNTYQALVVPAIANGMYIFLFKQFFEEIPDSLAESARIDGGSWFIIYYKIFMPLTKPVVLSASLLMFFYQWHSFIWPLLVGNAPELRVIQVALSIFKQEYETLWGEMFAASVITTILPLLFFFPLQKYYKLGITSAGLKE